PRRGFTVSWSTYNTRTPGRRTTCRSTSAAAKAATKIPVTQRAPTDHRAFARPAAYARTAAASPMALRAAVSSRRCLDVRDEFAAPSMRLATTWVLRSDDHGLLRVSSTEEPGRLRR